MDKLQKEFEAWLESEFGMWAIQARPGVYGSEQIQDMWKAWQAALSANGGEAVAWAAFDDNGDIRIWGREKPLSLTGVFPLYPGPAVKESLTVHGEPIGYVDPDSLTDYRAGDRLHMPVYRPDASADWQDGIPVYLHPAPPSVAVPEGLVDMLKACQSWLGGDRESVEDDESDLFRWDKLQHFIDALTAAPSPDHSGDANKMVADHIADAGKMIPVREAVPEMGLPVIGYNPDWIDPDFNERGYRECFTYGDATVPGGEWHTAKWVDGADQYETTDEAPTHWFHMVPGATPSVPENEVKARAILGAVNHAKANSAVNRGPGTVSESLVLKYALAMVGEISGVLDIRGELERRLRTAGDEGEEDTHG